MSTLGGHHRSLTNESYMGPDAVAVEQNQTDNSWVFVRAGGTLSDELLPILVGAIKVKHSRLSPYGNKIEGLTRNEVGCPYSPLVMLSLSS